MSTPGTPLPVWLTLCIFSLMLAKLILQRTRDFLYATVLSFFYIFLILAPLLQMQEGAFPWVDYYDNVQVEMSWWITATGLICFEFGYMLYAGTRSNSHVDRSLSSLSLQISPHGGVVLFGVAILCIIVGLHFNGVENLFLPRNEVSLLLDEKFEGSSPLQSMLKSLMRVPPTVILLIFIYDSYRRFQNAEPNWFNTNSLYTLVLGLLVLVINNPISTARFWVGAMVFSVFLLLLFLKNRQSASFWFYFNVAIVVAVFPLSDIYRKHLDFNPLTDSIEIEPTRELVTSPDFDAFQQQMNTTIVVDENGFSYGKQFLSSLFFFVPRTAWPDKAEPTGRYIAESLNYRFGNLSTPLMAEFYVDWGFPGVVLGMLLLGMLYQYLYAHAQQKTLLITVFYCFLSAYQFYLLRGSLMTVTNYMVVAIATILIVHAFSHQVFEVRVDDQKRI